MRFLSSLFTQSLLVRIIGLNSISVGVRLACGFVYNIVLARIVGPAGLALLGNLGNFMRSVQMFSTLGLESGLIAEASQHKSDKSNSTVVLGTGLILVLIGTAASALFVVLAAPWLSQLLLDDRSYTSVMRLMGVTLFLYSAFVFLTSLMQGWQHYKRFIASNIVIALMTMLVSVGLVVGYGLAGAIWIIVLAPLLQCGITLFFFRDVHGGNILSVLTLHWDATTAKGLLRYSVMGLLSAILVPVSLIYVRTTLQDLAGDEVAGWYEGMLRISSYYTLFVTSLVSLYVLPQFGKSADASIFRRVISKYLKTLVPLLGVGLILIYLLRVPITLIVFGKDFYGMDTLFAYQLIGDFFKTISVAMAVWFIARNDLKRYIISEVVSVTAFVVSASLLMSSYAAVGAVMAHMIAYIVYTVFVVVLLRKEIMTTTT
jgi:PST family polysaccharide transporter